MLKVSQVMTRLSVSLYTYNTVEDALDLLKEKKVAGMPVMNEQGHLAGMITKELILEKGISNLYPQARVTQYLTTRFVPLKEDSLISEVWDLPFDLYPVLNNQEEITGVVSKYALGMAYFQHTELRRQELETVFNSAHNGIIAINKHGVITSLNPAAEKPTRSTREEAVGRYLTDVILPTGLLEVVRTGVPAFGVKFQVGRRQYITNRTPIIKDGEVVGAVGVFQDVSEIETTLQELRSVKELNDELRTIIDSSFDGIIICDQQGEILRSSPAVERIFGLANRDLEGKPFRHLVDNGMVTKNIVHLVKKKDGPVSILERPYADHSLLITGNPVHDEDGEVTKIVINIRDISELSSLREALQESKQLSEKYQSEIAQMRTSIEPVGELICRSKPMKDALDLAWRVSQVDSPVVLIGENGVGKEVIAKFVHSNSERKKGPFYKLNCASLPEGILEDSLFGPGGADNHSKNNGTRHGVLAMANGGTLYLEDIAALPARLQSRLLKIIVEQQAAGQDSKGSPAGIRLIASSNQPLKELVDKGKFREDLFFVLNVVPIKIPPLRERKEDIIPLIHHYLALCNKRFNLSKEFAPDALHSMLIYRWPGNAREMVNLVERLVVTAPGQAVSAREVDQAIHEGDQSDGRTVRVSRLMPLKQAIDDLEEQLVTLAMEQYGTTVKAAEVLGVNQSTVVRKLKKLKNGN